LSEEPTDQALLEAWHAGSESAGNLLLRRHFPTLFRFFRSKVRDGVEDLVQQTMMACAESPQRFRGESSFRTYLLGIARGQLLMHLRRYARKGRRLDQLESSVASLLGSPSVALHAKDQRDAIVEALQNLPLDLQITIELYYWEEMKVTEIAEVMEVPAGTVKSRLNRSRRLLKEWIQSSPRLDAALRQATLELLESLPGVQ
jgi:RNA polymerase sigma-70 factor (ECF subfamily)